MKLIEALQIVQKTSASQAEPLAVFLACGFTPLHFKTLLTAELQLRFPERRVDVRTGLYGDLAGGIGALPEIAVVILEWPDLDLRLGIRNPGSWDPGDLPDILDASRRKLKLLGELLQRAGDNTTIALALPTLPLPPVPFSPGGQSSAFELGLRESLHGLAAHLARETGIRILSQQHLDHLSPVPDRWDVKGELLSGFPYKLPHAATLACLVARLLQPSAPKKGLITDLDDTLWDGILGEVGPEGISWDLANRSQGHALYQLTLRSLAETGVLIGAASKNDEALVRQAFQREDLLMPARLIFPCEVHWGRKSVSVGRILQSWNIGADSVVFVDDSPIELAEVKAQHPQVECLPFPHGNPDALLELLDRLRDLFGKTAVSHEDTLRRESLRNADVFHHAEDAVAADLLRDAQAELALSFVKDLSDPRPLELVNKTNQFNLNGQRYTETSWRNQLSSPDAFLMVASYRDKYSVLGKIAVLSGRKQEGTLDVDTWVMSCRAFSRRIEHRFLAELFGRFSADRILFHFMPTSRNGPLQDFFRLFLGFHPEGKFELTRQTFEEKCPPLFQKVESLIDG